MDRGEAVEQEDDAGKDDLSASGRTSRRRRGTFAIVLLAIALTTISLVVLLYPAHARGAAKVNGVIIARTMINQDLADISANSKYVALVNQPGGAGPVAGRTRGTYNEAFVAVLLDQQIRFEVIRQALAEGHTLPGGDQVAGARVTVSGQFPPGVFAAFPARYQTALATEEAETTAFVKSVAAELTAAGEAQYYQSHLNDYATEACVRHILIADKGSDGQVDYPASLADARKVKGLLDAGGDFAGLAKQYSADNQGATGGSAANGGILAGTLPDGCLSTQDLQQLVTEFSQSVVALPVNQVSEPVKTQFGYHLIEVTRRMTEPLDATVTVDIDKQVAGERVNQLLTKAAISVDPAFGTFDKTADPATGKVRGVVPPVASAK